jgi:hypothetical protein
MNSLSEGSPSKYARSVLEDFLKIDDLPRKNRRYVASLIKKMKRGKMINLRHVKGKIIACVDGVETHRRSYSLEEFNKKILAGLIDKHCQIAVHRDSKTDEVKFIEVYHRLVVITIITDRGPMPLAWIYQESEAGKQFEDWLKSGGKSEDMPRTDPEKNAAEKLKQEGELTALKKLLKDLKEENSQYLPFDVLIGDGLYDKSSILTEVERLGIALVAVHKDERRNLHQQAEEDFTTQKPMISWSENGRGFEGWQKIYEDNNINRGNKKVKIVRVIRTAGSASVDNYFYCSNLNFITPRFVEWCRHYRWKEENGFNAWTNQWKLLKHVFHHSHAASDAMVGLIFISVILVENYRRGNLKRGGYRGLGSQSLALFFREIIKGFDINSRKEFLVFLTAYLRPSSASP